jgi:hypothetical protein
MKPAGGVRRRRVVETRHNISASLADRTERKRGGDRLEGGGADGVRIMERRAAVAASPPAEHFTPVMIDEPKSDRSRRPGSTGILLVGWVKVANVCNAGS